MRSRPRLPRSGGCTPRGLWARKDLPATDHADSTQKEVPGLTKHS